MPYLALAMVALVAGLQVAVLARMAALDQRAVQIEASLEFMEYGRARGAACNGPMAGLLGLPPD